MTQMEFLALEFDRCKPWIEAALEYAGGTHRIEHIRESILRGDLQLWPGEHSAIVTEIEQYPLKRCLSLFLGGGKMEEIEEMIPKIERWAKNQWGCSSSKLCGRMGWQRTFLRDQGYKTKWTVMVKEL